MIIDIPFELGDKVYVIKTIQYLKSRRFVYPNKSLGGDADGPFDRGHYENIYETDLEIRCTKFHFGLLDTYNINEIYTNKEDANWALLNKRRKRNVE